MDKFTEADLLQKNVRVADFEGEKYFSVIDIRKHYPYTMFEPINVKVLSLNGEEMKFIRAQDIQEMDEFDKMMNKASNFKIPKK